MRGRGLRGAVKERIRECDWIWWKEGTIETLLAGGLSLTTRSSSRVAKVVRNRRCEDGVELRCATGFYGSMEIRYGSPYRAERGNGATREVWTRCCLHVGFI